MKCLYENLKCQIIKPNEIIIVDSSDLQDTDYGWFQDNWVLKELYNCEASANIQRNAGIDMLDDKSEIAAFIDDDVILENDFFEAISDIYESDRDEQIAGLGGFVAGEDEGFKLFHKKPLFIEGNELYKTEGLYGCNMTFRKKVVENEKFDENLLLYSYLDDTDFSLSASKYGLIVRTKKARLKHLRVSYGRISEVKLGFALLGNTFYVMKKHGRNRLYIYYHMIFNLMAKALKACFIKERRPRFKGSFIAFKQILSGSFRPQNIKFLK
jgi:GT2 family glycosyltransferase